MMGVYLLRAWSLQPLVHTINSPLLEIRVLAGGSPHNLSIGRNRSSHHQIQPALNLSFSCVIINCRSLLPKVPLLINFANIHDFDFIFLTETWLSESINSSSLFIPNYVLFRKDRSVRRGGGVIILVKSSIKCVDVSIDFLLPI